MRAKAIERAQARELRATGLSLRRIANELNVSISSVSIWVRDLQPVRQGDASPVRAMAKASGELKYCPRCKRQLPIESFNRHPRRGRQHWCRGCFIRYFRARGQLHRSQSEAARRRRRVVARAFVDEYLGRNPCVDCGEPELAVLEFDHTLNKQASLSVLVGAGWSIKRLKQEIDLCEVVCVNCHRRRTASRSPSWRADPGRLDTNQRLLPGERRNMQLIRDTLLQESCLDCGLSDLLVLEFDHVGSKRANVIALARRGCSLLNLQREIAECEVRCANCHRRRTRSIDQVAARAA